MKSANRSERWRRIGWAVLVAVTCVWAVNAFIQAYYFFVPNMDNWCYFAPSVTAKFPGRLTTPFLGSFGGADHCWGLQWPGVVLLNSALFSLLPANPSLWVAWQILLWIACAASLAWLTWIASASRLSAAAAYLFVLCDRALAFIAAWQRMELVALVVSTPLILALLRHARGQITTGRARALTLLCTLFAPWTHPLASALSVTTIALSLYLRRNDAAARRAIIVQAGVAVISLSALGAWFVLQPDLLAQFKDHAGAAATAFVPGQVLIGAMKEIYLPLISAPLFYLGGIALALCIALWRWRSRAVDADASVLWALAILTLALLAALHVFKNSYYIVFLLPPLLPLWAAVLVRSRDRIPWFRRVPTPALALGLFLVVGIHGGFWLTRGWKWRAAGYPNLRAELHQFWAALPAAPHIFIPEALWEEAVAAPKPAAEIRMNTIINAASHARRIAYESYAYSNVAPGDLLIVDDCQTNSPVTPLQGQQWELVQNATHHLPGQVRWGYGFSVYRAR